jgi:hypothetical protein
MKSIIKLFNKNFEKGITTFQIFLIGFMIIGAILNNQFLILFSMAMCLFGYFEPNQLRFSINGIKE